MSYLFGTITIRWRYDISSKNLEQSLSTRSSVIPYLKYVKISIIAVGINYNHQKTQKFCLNLKNI